MSKPTKIISIFLGIIILIGFIIFLVEQRKALLIIYFSPPDAEVSLNGKIYNLNWKLDNDINKFEKKLHPGIYEIEVSKKDFETHKETLTLKPKEKVTLKISLKISDQAKASINQEIEKTIRSQPGIFNIQYSTEIKEIKNNYAKVAIYPKDRSVDPFFMILKKDNNKWKVINFGTDISLNQAIKNTPKEALIKKLPYFGNNFQIEYIDYIDTFYVTIKNTPIEKVEKEAMAWFNKEGVDPKTIKIKIIISPVLIRK